MGEIEFIRQLAWPGVLHTDISIINHSKECTETDTTEAMPDFLFHTITFQYVAWCLSSRHNAQIPINSTPLDDSKYKDKGVKFKGEQVRREYGK